MSAEMLRRAAALIRERAEKAELSGDGEPWFPADELHGLIGGGSRNTADADHIASWHPAVALAVADLLYRVADDWQIAQYGYWAELTLAVARAYLGEA